MREFDALAGYPEPKEPRKVGVRGIKQRLIAAERGREFFDGARVNGYGGLRDDGRWGPVAASMFKAYRLEAGSTVLQIGAEKAFLLGEFARLGCSVHGTETSAYAREQAVVPLVDAEPDRLPFGDSQFDLVLAIGPVYTLPLAGAIRCLREIQRVGRGQSFVTLGAYEQEEDYWLFRCWSLLGTTILVREHWLEVMRHAGYSGDYKFATAKTHRLQWGTLSG